MTTDELIAEIRSRAKVRLSAANMARMARVKPPVPPKYRCPLDPNARKCFMDNDRIVAALLEMLDGMASEDYVLGRIKYLIELHYSEPPYAAADFAAQLIEEVKAGRL